MKTFSDFLTESQKTYSFIIRVAGDLPDRFADDLETSLDKFKLVNLSSGKKSPIQAKPLDFPQIENCEVTTYEAEVQYPTTPQVLHNYLSNCCGVNASYITVRNEGDPLEALQANKDDDAPYETLLDKEDMGGESAQDSVGPNRVMELLKELEKDRSEREVDPVAEAPKGESKDISSKENAKAVIGN
jgi:hypothetical protein